MSSTTTLADRGDAAPVSGAPEEVAGDLVHTHWSRMLYRDIIDPDLGADVFASAASTARSSNPAPPVFAGGAACRSRTIRRKGDRVMLRAADGYPLAATRYATSTQTRGHLVVAGAVGVPQRFYARFAEFAAAAGYTTMTLDYRGVGQSAPATLKGFRMDYFDWGRLDLAAAVDTMSGGVPLYVIAHSFGGHAFGVLPNQDKVSAFCTFGTGAGWHGWMPLVERLKVRAMWQVLGPLLTRWKGYLSWSLLGMGEDVPLDFYHRWKHWCRYPRYFFDDPTMQALARDFDRVRAPVMAANSIDDRWAPPPSRDAFMTGYRNATRHTLDIDPASIGLRAIGHLGYFRPDAAPLWDFALAWLAASAKSRSSAAVARFDDLASFWRSR